AKVSMAASCTSHTERILSILNINFLIPKKHDLTPPCVFAGPFCGLLLDSYGASVVRIDRPSPIPSSSDLLTAHKSSIVLDLQSPASVAVLLSLIPTTDILIDPFRPGVLEKRGL